MPERDDTYPWLSEFLCEYVDGTMRPAERALFEERIAGDPVLARHVARLVQARRLLCAFGCGVQAPCDLHETLRQRLTAEPADGARLRETLCVGVRHAAVHPHAAPLAAPTDAARWATVRAAVLALLLCTALAAPLALPERPATVGAAPAAPTRFADAGAVHPVEAAWATRRAAVVFDDRAPSRPDSLRRADRLQRIRAVP